MTTNILSQRHLLMLSLYLVLLFLLLPIVPRFHRYWLQLQADSIKDTNQLQDILVQATASENSKRRRALEITFLSPLCTSSGTSAGQHHQPQQQQENSISSSSISRADAGSTSSDLDDDEDLVTAAAGEGVDGEYEAGYSKQTRQRIYQAPVDIAQELRVPLSR